MRNRQGTNPQDDSANDGTVDPLFVRRQRVDPREHDQVSQSQTISTLAQRRIKTRMISKARPRHRPPGDILLVSLRRRPRLRLHRQVGEGQAEGADQVCQDKEFTQDQPY